VVFAHDTETALVDVAALINTDDPDGDRLATPADLRALAAAQGWTGRHRADRAELESVRALRPRLRALWLADEATLAAEVNRMLREARALPQLVAHDGFDFHLHAAPPTAPLADRMAVDAAMALVDVVRQHELDRLATCAAPGCDAVLVDLSKNRSRRYCSAACSSRVNVAAFRSRVGHRRSESGPLLAHR
jgi:predicted RNA-binding Zn ribbon-like protein